MKATNGKSASYDEKNFNDVYKKHFSKTFYYVLGKVHSKELAQDITQETFLKVNEHLNNFDSSKSTMVTWIYTIANNKIIDNFRTIKHNTISVSDYTDDNGNEMVQISDDNDNADNEMNNSSISDKVNDSLNNLKENYKQIAQMYFIEQLKYKEISEKLSVPISRVKVMIFRCREMLRNDKNLKLAYNTL